MSESTSRWSLVITMALIVLTGGAIIWLQNQRYQELAEQAQKTQAALLDQLSLIRTTLEDQDTRLNTFITRFEEFALWEQNRKPYPAPEAYRQYIEDNSIRWGVPIIVLCAIGETESDWNPFCTYTNYKTDGTVDSVDYGLFQLNGNTIPKLLKAYWHRKEKFDWKNPEHSIYLGAAYLAENYKRFGSWSKSIMAYNAGAPFVEDAAPGTVTKYLLRVQSKMVKFADNLIAGVLP